MFDIVTETRNIGRDILGRFSGLDFSDVTATQATTNINSLKNANGTLTEKGNILLSFLITFDALDEAVKFPSVDDKAEIQQFLSSRLSSRLAKLKDSDIGLFIKAFNIDPDYTNPLMTFIANAKNNNPFLTNPNMTPIKSLPSFDI